MEVWKYGRQEVWTCEGVEVPPLLFSHASTPSFAHTRSTSVAYRSIISVRVKRFRASVRAFRPAAARESGESSTV